VTDSFVNEASSYQGMMSVSFGLQHDVAASTPKRYDFSQAYFPEGYMKVLLWQSIITAYCRPAHQIFVNIQLETLGSKTPPSVCTVLAFRKSV
jgi:hypothetical protein